MEEPLRPTHREKIILVRGVHPNELDLAPEIARELRRNGHRVKVLRIPQRFTNLGHLLSGKGQLDHDEHFSGAAFARKIGFRYPTWHVIDLHSSPTYRTQPWFESHRVHVRVGDRGEKLTEGHHYFMDGSFPIPAIWKKGTFVPGEVVRAALEFPAVYASKASYKFNQGKFLGSRDAMRRMTVAYGHSVDEEKTFKLTPKPELVAQGVSKIEEILEGARQLGRVLNSPTESGLRALDPHQVDSLIQAATRAPAGTPPHLPKYERWNQVPHLIHAGRYAAKRLKRK